MYLDIFLFPFQQFSSLLGMQDACIDQFTSRLDDTLPLIKEVSSQFQNSVSHLIPFKGIVRLYKKRKGGPSEESQQSINIFALQ